VKHLIFLLLLVAFAGAASLQLSVSKPERTMAMGDKPLFESVLTNTGARPVGSVVLYISLVNLDKGSEHPVDLEDWSAQKAVHLDRLEGGAVSKEQWPMRLIQSGHYGLFVTAVTGEDSRPVTSEILLFDIQPKKTVIPSRIWPVAGGVPLLLLFLMALLRFKRLRATGR
jgi:hypothetical protein